MSTSPDMSPAAITARLKLASAQSDLDPERRLDAKLDMSRSGITARLREVAALLELCRALESFGSDGATIDAPRPATRS